MLKQRIITAIFMVAIMGSAILYLPALGFSLLMAALVLGASWEWTTLSGLRFVSGRLAFALSTAMFMAVSVWYAKLLSADINLQHIKDILLLGCLWWALALLWVKTYPGSASLWGSVFVRMLMGFLTLVPAWFAFVVLRLQEHGVVYILLLIGIVACADTGAYFAGRKWGRAKLAPNVSPGKSWAGFWGGMFVSSVFALVVWFFYGQTVVSLAGCVVIAVLTSLASVLGDLLESMVKRQRGVKDSGKILPGHGGLLDRLDSLTAAAPVFALSLLHLTVGS